MAKGGRVAVEKSARGISRWKGDDRDDEDEEYVAEEEDDLESESYEESLTSSSDSELEGGKSRGNSEDSSGSDDGSFDEGSDFEFDESEFEEEEEIQVKRSKKGRKKSSGKKRMDSKRKVSQSDEDDEDFDVKPVLNQNRRRRSLKSESEGSDYEEEDDDEDFDDLDEDEDFTPDVEDEDEEIFSISKRNNGYRKEKISRSPVKRARKSKKSRVSRQKKPTTATKHKKDMESTKKRRRGRKRSSPKEPAIKQRRRLAQIKDDDFIVDDDDDFILEDRAEAKKKNNKRKFVSDSDTSEFEFVTSDEDDFVIQEEIKPKKRKKYTMCCSGTGSDSSDSDYVIHEEEEEVVKEVRKRNREVVKGKEKEEEKEEDSGRKVCGICLSEEQRRTTRGVLDCCPHFFCFACIVEWSKVESRCPVCKRRFETITKASSSDSDDLGFGAPKKVIKVPKRDQVYQPSEEDIRGMLDPYENVVCMECQQGGDDNLMLLCDICDSSAHTYCVGLGNSVPEGNWYCDCCRSAGAGPSNLQPQPQQQQPSVVPSDPAATEFEPFVNVQSTPSLSSALEIDLNASPRDVFEEAGTQVLRGPSQVPSPSAGGAATLSSRRAIRNRIRIILSNTRSMQVVRRNGEEANAVSNGVGIGLRVGRSVGQQGSILAPHRERGGTRDADRAKEQVQTMVKNHLKQLCSGAPLDRDAFKEVARRATYTVLAVCGFGVEHRNLVSNSISAPMGCSHEIQDSEQTSLLAGSCSACFDSFVRDVVANILNRG